MPDALDRLWTSYKSWILGSAIWLLLAGVHTAVLFMRGRFLMDGLALQQVALWQFLVWLPWIFIPVFIRRALDRERSGEGEVRHGLKTLIPIVAVLAFHMVWVILSSHYTSPFDAEGTDLDQRWGIFRFHLIFWGLIDLMALGTLVLYFILGDKREAAAQGGAPGLALQQTITVKDRNRTEVILLEEVICVTSEDYYARIHTDRGDFLIRTPLKTLAEEWPGQFFLQTHRSSLVNLKFLKTLDRKKNQAVMSDGTRCPVSRSGMKRLRAFLEQKS